MTQPRQPVTRIVLAWMHKHPAQIHHYKDIAAEVGIPATRVEAALNRMVHVHPEYGVTKPPSKGGYMYRVSDHTTPEAKVAPMIYEEVGTTSTGETVVRDEKGLLYKLSTTL